MQFQLQALSAQNLVETHLLEACDEAEARRQAEANQLTVLTIAVANPTKTFGQGNRFSLVLFSQELLALLEAGLSLVECIEALQEKEANPLAASVLAGLFKALREGERFSAALAQQPVIFPPLYIGIVQAAEGTSELPQALSRYLDYQIRLDEIRSRLISAAIYPSILITVGGGVALFLLGFVVPRFAAVYQGTGRPMPMLSQLLLDWGQFVAHNSAAVGLGLLAGLTFAGWQLRLLMRSGAWRSWLARVPGIGERMRILELSRLYLTLGMLLEGGIPISTALGMVSGVAAPTTRTHLAAAAIAIREGEMMSDAFDRNALSTPISLRMLRVGERSGQMGAMLTRSANFYESETTRWIERFTKTFEPLLMTAIGLVIGGIVILLYMPIFDLAGSL
ncbi:type II secretion system F family protein [Chitinimonas sp. BJB300]|uniref:type II secretion system F family protein n=1 Tax=Chitinimonas sp. BJB300 TaxID=1559339 RepID=UPI000C102C8C|nr:type II secretion system F family protein [Chitinimonas sp. BJB300]PHV11012.1 type II secretion system protein [Chitinimonas sp. BJB300]TSJ87015.1 type II secretion system F family protein [Chitinimonas sp. BJB300]